MKFERKQRWQSMLLCMLIVNQMLGSIAERVASRRQDLELSVPKFYNDFENDDSQPCPVHNDQCSVVGRPREKRIILTILFVASLVATLANIGFDIYLQIKGCQGIYPSIKTNVDEFERIRKDLAKRTNDMNKDFIVCENIRYYTDTMNLLNMGIMTGVKRIMLLTEQIMENLSPLTIVQFRNKATEIKQQLKKHNETVENWSFLDLELRYDGIFSSLKSALFGLAPIVGILGQAAIGKMYNWYKISKIAKSIKPTATSLSTSVKARQVFGAANANKAIAQTAKAQFKVAQGASKMAKFAKFAGGLASVVSIGLEIFLAFKKVEACKEQRDESKRGVDKLRPEEAKFATTEDQLVEFRNNLTTSYNHVKHQITSDSFLKYASTIKQLADNVSNPPLYILKASKDITTFLKEIKTAGYGRTHKLQVLLDSAFGSVKFTFECYENKIKTLTHTYDGCKKGAGTIRFLFDFAVKLYDTNKQKCTLATGKPYTSFPDTSNFVVSKLKVEGYQEDCILNSPDMKSLACIYFVQGFGNVAIMEKSGLTASQVAFFIQVCPPAKITPAIKKRICQLRQYQSLSSVKVTYSRYNQAALTTVYNACSLPPMPDVVKQLICAMKKSRISLSSIRIRYNQYPTKDVDRAYNTCIIPKITSEIKSNICDMKNKYNVPLSSVVALYKDYPVVTVSNTYNDC